jgi:hypothetical protein
MPSAGSRAGSEALAGAARAAAHNGPVTPADIDPAARTLRPRGWRRAEVAWSTCTRVQATRLASLADEVGLVLHAGSQALYVRETDAGFADLAAHLRLAVHWGADWLARAEAGAALSLDL